MDMYNFQNTLKSKQQDQMLWIFWILFDVSSWYNVCIYSRKLYWPTFALDM